MSLWQKAYETYENHAHLVGVVKEGDKQALTPVGHIIQKAQIEITLTADGTFVSVFAVPSDRCKTIIPATEASASRTSSPCAHPFSDQVQYLADFGEKKTKENVTPHTLYLRALTDWAESEYTHPKVQAVLRYIQSEALLDDIKKYIPNCTKIEGTELAKCLVRWIVSDVPGCKKSACWEDASLFAAFEAYQNACMRKNSRMFCMVSGKDDILTESHPKGIVAASYGAKLLSANDNSGFTYRGRFTDSRQALSVGYTASQKMHNAIQWVAANQGVIFGGRTFICWNPKGKQVLPTSVSPWEDTPGESPKEPTAYKKQLHDTMAGHRNALPAEEDVVIASFDAATTGRLSVMYYNELKASDYYDRIEKWYASCCIENGHFGIQSPWLIQIVKSAYGTERNGLLEVDDKVLAEQFGRLYHCLIDASPIPADMVRSLQIHASEPTKYKKNNNHDTVLFAACAVIRKYRNDKAHKEEWSMVLDTENHDRSYLFGRLLAVMEHIERSTYDSDETREPNAIRLQSVYCNRPLHTAKIIEERLSYYFQKIKKPALRVYWKNMLEDIYTKFDPEDSPRMNLPLEETYLLGYYLQRNALYHKKDKTETTEENEQ